jgi:hypothetical protein
MSLFGDFEHHLQVSVGDYIIYIIYIIFPITSWVMFNQDNSPTPDLPLCVARGMRPKALKLSFKLMRLQSHGHG